MADDLRIGLAGAGAISQYHLAGSSETANARVVSICDIDEAKARARAQVFNIPNVYTDFRTMIECEELDAVDIVTPVGDITQARMTVRCRGMIEVNGVPPFLLNRQPYLKDFKRLLIFEVLIHNLDAMRVLLGPLDVVTAQVAKVNRDLAGEDAAVVLLKGNAGLTAVLDGNISAPGCGPLPTDRLDNLKTLKPMEASYVAAGVKV